MKLKWPFPISNPFLTEWEVNFQALLQLYQKAFVRRPVVAVSTESAIAVISALESKSEKEQYIQASIKLIHAMGDIVIAREQKVRYKANRFRYLIDAQVLDIFSICTTEQNKVSDGPSIMVLEKILNALILFAIAGRIKANFKEMAPLPPVSSWVTLFSYLDHAYGSDHLVYGEGILDGEVIQGLGMLFYAIVCYGMVLRVGYMGIKKMQIELDQRGIYQIDFGQTGTSRVDGPVVYRFLQSLHAYLPAMETFMSDYQEYKDTSEEVLEEQYEKLLSNQEVFTQATQDTVFMEYFCKTHYDPHDLIVLIPYPSKTDLFMGNFVLMHNMDMAFAYGILTGALENATIGNIEYNKTLLKDFGISTMWGEEYRILGEIGITKFSNDVWLSTGVPLSTILKKAGLSDYETFFRAITLEISCLLIDEYKAWKKPEVLRREYLFVESDTIFLERLKKQMAPYQGGIPTFNGEQMVSMFQKLGFSFIPGKGDHSKGVLKLDKGGEIQVTINHDGSFGSTIIKKQCKESGIPWEFAVGTYLKEIRSRDTKRLKILIRSGYQFTIDE